MKTQLLGVWVLFCIVFLYSLKRRSLELKNYCIAFRSFEFRELAVFLFYVSIVSTVYILYYGYMEENLYPIHPDHSYYSQISIALNEVGIENINLSEVVFGADYLTFYHYFELWMTALLYPFFGLNALYTLEFTVFPILSTFAVYGVCSLVVKYFNKVYFVFKLGFPFVLFVLSSFPNLFDSILRTIGIYSSNYAYSLSGLGCKLAIVYVCIIWALLNVNGSLFSVLFPFVLCSILYHITMPVIFVSVSIFLIYNCFINKRFNSWNWVLLFSPFLFAVVFYFAFSSKQVSDHSVGSLLLNRFMFGTIGGILKIMIGNMIEFSLSRLLPFIPFLFLFLLLFGRIKNAAFKHRDISILFVLILSTSVISFGFVFGIQDSSQLSTNILYPVLNVSAFLLFSLAFTQRKIVPVAVATVLIMLLVHAKQNLFFVDKSVERNICNTPYNSLREELEGKIFSSAFIYNSDSYVDLFTRNIDFFIPFDNARRFTNSYKPIC